MKEWKHLEYKDNIVYKKRGKSRITSDTIYTCDIEVSSLFNVSGVWESFDYELEQIAYSGVPKAGVPYIWMFGVEDQVYYGRHFTDLLKVFKMISDSYVQKVIWIHNLSYEMQFFLDLFEGYTITNMTCRDKLKPIAFDVKELNLKFRCSYMLTNMALDTAAKEYGKVFKLSGQLDYNLARGEDTELSEEELAYCEHDILSLHSIIKYHYLPKYEHIVNIPLTSTGEVRRDLRAQLDYWYFKNNPWRLVPTKDMYLRLRFTFAGGYTHSNMIHSGKIIRASDYGLIYSWDIASSYPGVLVTEKFACQHFKQFTYDRYLDLKKRDSYCFFFEVEFKNVKSKYYNHYISFSKIFDYGLHDITTDNGRVMAGTCFKMWLTDIDLEIIEENYNFDIEFLQIFGAYKDFLDERIIKYVLKQYGNKTTLKGVKGQEALYKKSKANNNCIYGLTVTDALKNSTTFSMEKGWKKLDYDDDEAFDKFVDDTLKELKHSYSNIMCYAVGVWVTAYARRNVYKTLLKLDSDVLYCDTDSIKYIGEHDDIFEEYNNKMIDKYNATIKRYKDLSLSDFMPLDSKGNKRPIGFFEREHSMQEFCTLGAKKYCFREVGENEPLQITVSGVSKKGAVALNDDITNFKKGFTWGYKESGKLTHIYMDDQPEFNFLDYKGKVQHSTQKHGVVLQPTTYTLGLSDIYESLINSIMEQEVRK